MLAICCDFLIFLPCDNISYIYEVITTSTNSQDVCVCVRGWAEKFIGWLWCNDRFWPNVVIYQDSLHCGSHAHFFHRRCSAWIPAVLLFKVLSYLSSVGLSRLPPPPLHLGYAYARSLPLKAPPCLRTAKMSEPLFRGLFAGFSCLGDPPKSGMSFQN